MANRTLHSSAVTFLDYTDNRKLEVYIASNLPSTQIYDINNGAYSPNWVINPLTLTADVFLDSQKITDSIKITAEWLKKTNLNDAETPMSTGTTLTIPTNEMSGDTSIITYVCKATYKDNEKSKPITAYAQVTFHRSDSGRNGDKGADGTSVNILGAYDTLGALQAEHPTGNKGDAYIIRGVLYVWDVINLSWKATGNIQGPPGVNGADAKYIALTADSQVFRINKSGTPDKENITITAQVFDTSVENPKVEWSYKIPGTETFSTTKPPFVTQIVNQVTVGKSYPHNILVVKATYGAYSDTYTIYKVFDGGDGSQGAKGDSAPTVFLTNENITFNADAQGESYGAVITTNVVAYKGDVKITPIISSQIIVPDDYVRATEYTNGVIYYVYSDGNIIEANPQPINADEIRNGNYYIKSISISIKQAEESISKEAVITINVKKGSTFGSEFSKYGEISIPVTYPVNTILKLHWSKINAGSSGKDGADAVTFKLYSENGYVLSKDIRTITLRTFAYSGSSQIASGTYKWYKIVDGIQNIVYKYQSATTYIAGTTYYSDNNGTVANPQPKTLDEIKKGVYYIRLGEANNAYLEVSHSDVSFSTTYMCEMMFNGVQYVDVATIDDKNDSNTVFTSKPRIYAVGDIWVVGNDYIPNGVELGTVLRSEKNNNIYNDNDWVKATKYDKDLEDVKENLKQYNEHFSFDSQNGLRISAVDSEGNKSKFSTTLSHTQLSFNEGEEAVAYVGGHKMHMKEAEIESPLSVTGLYSGGKIIVAPTINLGANFSMIIEDNESFSIVSNL